MQRNIYIVLCKPVFFLKNRQIGFLSHNLDSRSGWGVPLCSRDCGAANKARVSSSISYRKACSTSRCHIKEQLPTCCCCCCCYGYRPQATNDFPARNNIDLYRRTIALQVKMHGWDSRSARFFILWWNGSANLTVKLQERI